MATNDRPKLGGAFRSTPDRTSGLGGLLQSTPAPPAPTSPRNAPSPAPAAPEPADDQPTAEDSVQRTSTVEKARSVGEPRRRGRRAVRSREDRSSASSLAGPEDVPRAVPVVLDAPVLARLREVGRQSGMTHGLIALGAIENHAEELEARWSSDAAKPRAGGLFGRTQPQHRRSEPGVQTQLRLAAGDAEVLDDLVVRWSAPSRSALVNDALILEIGQS